MTIDQVSGVDVPQENEEWFKESDFLPPNNRLAMRINEKIAKILAEAPTVYGDLDSYIWTPDKTDYDTHSAKLVCIRELPKEKCEHDGNAVFDTKGKIKWVCVHCGAPLSPVGWRGE